MDVNQRTLITGLRVPCALLTGILALSVPLAVAGPGDVNSINNGQIIQGGTYWNTAGSHTTFQNTSGTGIWLQGGTTVRGLESNINKVPTGNGGTVEILAPGQVVRLDGTMDLSAIRSGSRYLGNGGKLFVDSGYLFQNGNIFANGANGGLVQFNVGGLTLGNTARITAQGFGGDGGRVSINSPGTVDLQFGSVIDTSGKVAGTFNTNMIAIDGGAVNNQAILRANGLSGTDLKPDNGDANLVAANPQLLNNPTPGPISPGNGVGDTSMPNILFETPGSADFRGGTVKLTAHGQTFDTSSIINGTGVLTASEKSARIGRNNQVVQFNNGDVFQRGAIEANGGLSKNGGSVILTASRNIINSTTIQANGSNSVDGVFNSNGSGGNGGAGGAVAMVALGSVNNSGTVQANGGNGARANNLSVSSGNGANANAIITGVGGNGGTGGVIAINAASTSNSGSLQANGGVGGSGGHANAFDTESGGTNPEANATATGGAGGVGGHGGMIAIMGNSNPTGGGSVQANGGQGGTGGNAWADAQSFSNSNPTANATATRGAGGAGGAQGSIIAVNPGNFGSTQSFSTKAGGSGNSGSAASRTIRVINGVNNIQTNSTPVSVGSVVTGADRAIIAARRNELISHEENSMLFSQGSGAGSAQTTLSGRLNDSLIRTVLNPNGASGGNGAALANAEASTNFTIASTASNQALTNDLVNSNINPLFFRLENLTVMNNGNITNNTLWTPGVQLVGEGFHDIAFSLGGGRISMLANGSITNNQIMMTRGQWAGGSTNLTATQDVINNNDLINIGLNKALLSGFSVAGPPFESSHAGSLIVKAGRDFTNTNNGKIQSNLIFFDIHPPLNQNPPIDWPRFLNGAQIGSNNYFLAGRNFLNNGIIRADALTYRNGTLGAQNPALTTGGNIFARAGGSFVNNGAITALGNAFFSPNDADGPRFNTNTFGSTTSFNGTINTP